VCVSFLSGTHLLVGESKVEYTVQGTSALFEASAYNTFLCEATALVQKENVVVSGDEIDITKNVGGFQREALAKISVESREQVIAIVESARIHGIHLYPVSRGKNWGMGSSLPATDHCVVLDMSRMNRIKDLDLDNGVVTIEPGVTQQKLADTLLKENSRYYLDVTGSGAETSIIGNCLERGVSYNAHRVDIVINFEVLLADGRIVKTGYSKFAESRLKNLYRHGVGPSLDGLFFQSNFGIVLSATIELTPIPESTLSMSIELKKDASLAELVDAFRRLVEKGAMSGVPHIFNRDRFLPALAPILFSYLKDQGREKTRQEVEKSIEKLFKADWFVAGALSGTHKATKAQQQEVKKELKKVAKVRFLTESSLKWIKRIARLFRMQTVLDLMAVTEPLRGLSSGKPTNLTIPSVYWPAHDEKNLKQTDPDQGQAGVIYLAPLSPFNGKEASELVTMLEEIGRVYGLPPAISLNAVSRRFLEGVVSIHFDRQDEMQLRKAQNCAQEMVKKCFERGFTPYRLCINTAHHAKPDQDSVEVQIKNLLDPSGTIAPGRYGL
jgi:4-cresol dehydrogenase (hydroxylating)